MAISLVAIYLFTLFKPLAPIIHYTANFGVYVNELCENKDKPELNCKGTCALAKKLQLDNEVKDKPTLPLFESLDWYIGLIDNHENFNSSPVSSNLDFETGNESWYQVYLERPTPPPIVVA